MTIRSMTVTEARNVTAKRCAIPRTRVKLIIGLLLVLIVISAISGYFIGTGSNGGRPTEIPDPVFPPPPSWSKLHTFRRGAVCTDSPECSEVGRDVLNRNGSAVDAAIAAMFCNGLHNQMSMGIGGGFLMTVYIKRERKAYAVIARETAPNASYPEMFNADHDKSLNGPLAVAVPGEVRGMWTVHQRWGVLPWADLIAPTLKICRSGYRISKALYDGLLSAPYIINDTNLRKVYYDEEKKAFFPVGTTVYQSETLCKTLQRIADHGGDDFYNGSLAADILKDLKRAGSIITAEDLANYRAQIKEPIHTELNRGFELYTPPPPSSGVLLAFTLNILKGYKFDSDSISTSDDMVLTYHRIVEAFKYVYAARTKLGDEDFLDLKELINNLTSTEYGASIRRKINDTTTSNDSATYGVDVYNAEDAGTAHISIIAPSGDAVSITSSINYYFGAGFTTLKTGIVLNDVMDDFSYPGIVNMFGLKPSPSNFIAPGKRAMSSMSPSIIVDSDGNARMVVGASGGTKIVSAVALTIIRKLWFKQNIKQAVDAPRFHHQIFPMKILNEYGITEDVINGLKAKGHEFERYRTRGSVVCALYRNETAIYANADYRKGGNVAGIH